MMDGKALAARIRAELAEEVRALGGVRLATVLAGDDPASHLYIGMKHRACQEVGIEPVDRKVAEGISQAELLELVDELNADGTVDGILVQSPLPAPLEEPEVFARIDPVKDVDGLNPVNLGRLVAGEGGHRSATPLGVMTLLREYDVPLEGARAVVIGRSVLVGKPMALLLQAANATVTMCHSRTRELAEHLRSADVIVAAVGVPGLVKPGDVKPGAVVVDVGQVRVGDRFVGDVDPGVAAVAALLTPVPGGVGPMTIASLLQNTVQAARYRRGDLALAETPR